MKLIYFFLSLFFNNRKISRTEEWNDSTIQRKRIYREEGIIIINSLSTSQGIRNLTTTQKHKNIWNFFYKFLNKRFPEEDLSEILDADENAR